MVKYANVALIVGEVIKLPCKDHFYCTNKKNASNFVVRVVRNSNRYDDIPIITKDYRLVDDLNLNSIVKIEGFINVITDAFSHCYTYIYANNIELVAINTNTIVLK